MQSRKSRAVASAASSRRRERLLAAARQVLADQRRGQPAHRRSHRDGRHRLRHLLQPLRVQGSPRRGRPHRGDGRRRRGDRLPGPGVPDPAETASFAYRRFVRFAADEPELAAVLTKLDDSDAMFEQSLLPYARKTLERGIESGRFDIVDIDLALLSVSAAAFAAIKGVLAGRISAGLRRRRRGDDAARLRPRLRRRQGDRPPRAPGPQAGRLILRRARARPQPKELSRPPGSASPRPFRMWSGRTAVGSSSDRGGQLLARRDALLAEHPPQVPFDGAGTDQAQDREADRESVRGAPGARTRTLVLEFTDAASAPRFAGCPEHFVD